MKALVPLEMEMIQNGWSEDIGRAVQSLVPMISGREDYIESYQLTVLLTQAENRGSTVNALDDTLQSIFEVLVATHLKSRLGLASIP